MVLCCVVGVAAASSWGAMARLAGIRGWLRGAAAVGVLAGGLVLAVDHAALAQANGYAQLCKGVFE
jgi:hypothetical protein